VGLGNNFVTGSEVLNIDFYTSDPAGDRTLAPNASLDTFYMIFDVYSGGDPILLLKLKNALGAETTKTLVIESSDFITSANSLTDTYGISAQLTGSEAAIIVESNDYNLNGEAWSVYGAQFLASSGELTSTSSLSFDPTSGSSVDTTQAFDAGTADADSFTKINVGGTQSGIIGGGSAELTFAYVVGDSDGDESSSDTFTITIDPAQTLVGTSESEIIRGTTGADVIIGGGGVDSIYLGSSDGASDTVGLDTYDLVGNAASADLIYEFEVGTDKLDLNNIASTSSIVEIDTESDSGNSIVIVDGSIAAVVMGVDNGLGHDVDLNSIS